MPEPNVSWGFAGGSRVMSKSPGASNSAGSRFACASDGPMNVPFGKRMSRYSMSSLAKRAGAAYGAEVAHRLLDRSRCELGPFGEQLPLVGVGGEQ